jgi:predicted transposase YbfD/YdcC
MLEDQLNLAKSIVKEWKSFSSKVISYNGSPGIAGRLFIIFSNENKSFLMALGPCNLLKTNFKWQTEELIIDINHALSTIVVSDFSNDLLIHTKSLSLYEFSNHQATNDIIQEALYNEFLPLTFDGIKKLNSIHQIIRNEAIRTELQIDQFEINTNSLKMFVRYHLKGKKNQVDIDCGTSIIFKDASHFFFERKEIFIEDIEISRRNNIFHITDKSKKIFLIECYDIYFCNDYEISSYISSVRDEISFFSMPTLEKTVPVQIAVIKLPR